MYINLSVMLPWKQDFPALSNGNITLPDVNGDFVLRCLFICFIVGLFLCMMALDYSHCLYTRLHSLIFFARIAPKQNILHTQFLATETDSGQISQKRKSSCRKVLYSSQMQLEIWNLENSQKQGVGRLGS